MAAVEQNTTDIVFVIGKNDNNEFGLGHSNRLTNLTNFSKHHSHLNIRRVYLGYSFIIIKDSDNNYWSCGSNHYGQCCVAHKDIIKIPQPLEFFNKNGINITKICLNKSSKHLFWIDDKQNIYGNGRNENGELGVGNKDNTNKYNPILVKQLNNIIDIRCSGRFSVALCASINDNHVIIIKYWCQIYQIPDDIINIIIMFSKYTKVYSTEYSSYGGNGRQRRHHSNYDTDSIEYGWKEIDELLDTNIVKIRTGAFHSLFVDSNSSLYGCGGNAYRQIGLGHTDSVWTPTLITNKIQINHIECGYNHTLIIDYNAKIWVFGSNTNGQCGNGNKDPVKYPEMIQVLKKYDITDIDCGGTHSYCKTSDKQHFLWGCNESNECITFDQRSDVLLPFPVNDIIKEKCNAKIIKSICLAIDNTMIIVGNT